MADVTDKITQQQVRDRIFAVLIEQQEEAAALKEDWEPVFDSLAVVEILYSVEDMLPEKVSPARIVRKGGYDSASEAATNISQNLFEIIAKKAQANA